MGYDSSVETVQPLNSIGFLFGVERLLNIHLYKY